MLQGSTSNFLRLLAESNARIAAQEAEEASKQHAGVVGVDQVRLQKDAERRERLGQLRARPKNKRNSTRVHNIFGYTDLT